jgi:hypothetical protein
VPVVAVSANPKVTETFNSMANGQRAIGPANATARQLAVAVLDAQSVPAAWEVEQASRSVGAVLASAGP